MSIKKLFDAKKAGTLGGATRSTLKKLGDNVESPEQIEAALSKARAFSPKIDFSDPANFVKYGSAYRYYYDTFGYIKDYYPYDGSSREKLEFYNGLSPFEQYIFNNEYPKTTGYVTIGAIYGTDGASKQGYTTPTTAEYIQFKGGPHSGTFFATGSGLSNNLEFGGISGSTVEFFYNKTEFDSTISSPTEVILDIWNGVSSGSHDYGRLTIETDSGSADRFYVSYQSGSSGVFKASVPTAGGLTLGSGSWDHYAFVFSNSDDSTSIDLYENGTCKQSNILTGSSINLVTGSLIGRLGALRTAPGPIQASGYGTQATATDAIDMAGYQAAGDPAIKFNITIPVAAGGSNTTITIKFDISSGGSPVSAGADHITIGTAGSNDAANAALVIKAINGDTDSRITYGNGSGDGSSGIGVQGLTASAGSSSTKVTLTISKGGTSGNINSAVAHGAGTVNVVDVANFTGGAVIPAGDGKLSASLDEFRFWKEPRTAEEIGRNWYMGVNGGANTTINNSGLGIYYKFNEGITQVSTTDNVVLDYSSRLSNGAWTGYSTSGTRNTGSAIVSSSAAGFETADPIIYDTHPTYISSRDDLSSLGQQYDYTNNSSLYYTMPGWIIEQDERNGEELAKLTQIMGSYLDTLYAQVGGVLTVKDVSYPTGSVQESPNNDRLLSSLGFEAPDLFDSVGEIVRFLDKDDKRPLESSIHQIKNIIYKNIYNNLSYILKSKGTRKSFGNTLRCMGIDEKIVKISTYADNVEQTITSSYKAIPTEKKFVDFSGLRRYDDQAATIYQHYYADGYDGGSSGLISGNLDLGDNAFTLQADILFPLKPSPAEASYIEPTSPSSSLFGFHTPKITTTTSTDTAWASNTIDFGLQVYAVHATTDYSEITSPQGASRDAYFVVEDRFGNILLKTDTVREVYQNTRWVFALSARPKTYPFSQEVDGTDNDDQSYIIELYGTSFDLEDKRASFDSSKIVNFVTGSSTLASAKRIYAGAHRTDFSGSLLTRSDIRLNSCRFWNTFLTSSVVDQQAKDADAYGLVHPYRNVKTFQTSGSSVFIPAIESLALNWDFETVTGSDASGQFRVDDFSSGSNSTAYENNYQVEYAGTVQRHHSARGDFFKASDTPVRKEYFPSLRLQAPEELSSDDMITVIVEGSDDSVYGRAPRPIRHFFAVEKSMYDAISNDMLEMFASIDEFNNLIGEPVNKYRAEYKDLKKLREIFFRRVTGQRVDLDKYLDYYKWFDGALTNLVEQLFPASAPVAENTRNVVESHVLERNKYQHKYPTLEEYPFEPSGSIKGGYEQQYSWRFNHHPITMTGSVASAADAIDMDGYQAAADPSSRFTIQIPVAAGGSNTTITIKFDVSSGGSPSSYGANAITIATAGSDDASNAALVVKAINGTADSRITYGNAVSVGDGCAGIGVLGITAAEGSNNKKVTLTMTVAGTNGNITSAIAHGAGTVNLVDVNDFTGASDDIIKNDQGENCSWWANRAERNANPLNLGPNAVVGAATTLDRQNIFTSVRKKELDNQRNKFYKFGGAVEKSVAGGHNQSFNKIKANVLSFDQVSDQSTCTDEEVPAGSPLEKSRQKFRISIAGQTYKGDRMAPFSLYKALVPSEHNKQLTNTGLSGSHMTNIHEDSYYGSGFEVPMQGPFTSQHVGGLLARARTSQIEGAVNLRRENYRLTIASGTGSLARLDTEIGANSSGKGHYYRGITAKRPVNIANIAHQTASDGGGPGGSGGTIVGNFDKNYQVLQTSGRKINNLDFRDDPDAYNPSAFLSPYVGGLVETPVPSRRNTEYTLKARTTNKTIFVNRFSSPGSVETNTPAFLDFNSQEIAPNNALPFRNMLIRSVNEGHNTLSQGWGGHINTTQRSFLGLGYTIQDLNTGSFSTVVTSRHDVNRNAKPKPFLTQFDLSAFGQGQIESIGSGSIHNNNFITTPIPQADNMSWFMAYSGSDTQTYNHFFHSGGLMPESITVPSPPNLEGQSGINEGTPFSISAVAELTTIGIDARDALGSFDKFTLSGAAWVVYDYTGSSWLFSTDLSGASGPTGHESLLSAGAINNIHYVDISSVSNAKGVMTAMSSAISASGIGQVATDGTGDLNQTASITNLTIRSHNNPGVMEITSSAQAFSNIFILPDEQGGATFLSTENDLDKYTAAASAQSAMGASTDVEGVTATTGYLRSLPFDGLSDYRTNDASAIFTASNGQVQYRWGAGNNYNSWQQVRQSQLRSRESIVKSNQINVFEVAMSNGNQVETQVTLDDPFLFISAEPIKTILSVVDENSPEDGQLKFRDITVKHSYGNQRQGFINGDANVKHKYTGKGDKFLYDSLRDIRSISYSKNLAPEETGIGRIKSHEITQQIYPQARHQFLSESMLRNNYLYTRWQNDDDAINNRIENDLHVVSDLFQGDLPNPDTDDKVAGRIELIYKTHNRQVDRLVVGYTNSQNYTLEEHYQHPFDIVDGIVAKRTGSGGASTDGTASIWPLDSFLFSDSVYSGSIPVLSGVTVGSISASAQYGIHDAVRWDLNFFTNLGAGELMWFRAGAAARTGSQGYAPQGWYTRRNCQYINQMVHLDFDSLSSGVNYTQSVFGPSMGGALFMPPWTAGRDRRAVDGNNKGELIGSRGPFYNTYEDFADGVKLVGRGMGIIPEFRISEHIDHYEGTNNGDYFAANTASYSITGSAITNLNNSADDGFMKRFQNTDFIKYLSQFMVEDQDMNGLPTDLKLEAQAVQRLLPYDGFYPVIRTLQIATLFSQSYSPGLFPVAGGLGAADQTEISASGWQNILDYFYAPGIMYNSIKSGLAVDHPVFTVKEDRIPREKGTIGEVLSGSTDAQTFAEIVSDTKRAAGLRQSDHTIGPLTSGGGSRREITKFYKDIILPRRLGTAEEVQPTGSEEFLAHQIYFPDRIPFETIINPTDYLLQNKFNSNQTYDWFRNDTTSSFSYFANNKYVKGAGNFFGAIPDVFLENSRLTSIATDPNLVDPQAISVQSGTLYAMEVALRKTDQFNMYSNPIAFGPPTATGSAFNSGDEILATQGQATHTFDDDMAQVVTGDWGMVRYGYQTTAKNLLNASLTGSMPSGSGWPLLHGNHAPYTPPYWYGESFARIYYSPTASGMVTINEILEEAQYEYGNANDYLFDFRYNDLNKTDVSASFGSANLNLPMNIVTEGAGGLGLPPYMWNRAWQNKMEIKASLTINNRHPGNIQPNNAWVIMPKWECPILDFPVRAEPWASTSGSYNFTASFAKVGLGDRGLLPFTSPANGREVCPQQGMWHQYGVVPDAGEGVQMVLRDISSGDKEKRMKAQIIYPGTQGQPNVIGAAEEKMLPKIPNSLMDITAFGDRKRKVRSLAKLVGFPSEVVNKPVDLGRIANKKTVHEAIIALPYYEDAEANIQFIPIPLKDESNQVVSEFGKQTAKLRKSLSKYILPPVIEQRMSYLVPESYPLSSDGEDLRLRPDSAVYSNEDPPLAMYLFEFTTELSKQDLADWWQGIMPEPSTKFNNTTMNISTIDHAMPGIGLQDFGAKPGAGGGKVDERLRDLMDTSRLVRGGSKNDPGFRPDIKWMVFKVKQRAPATYEELIKKSLTEAGAKVPGATGQTAYENRPKGFNWPYDFFSVIELAKINTTVTFRPDIDTITVEEKENTTPVKSLEGGKREEAQVPPPKRGRPKKSPAKKEPAKKTTAPKKNPPKKLPPKAKSKPARPKDVAKKKVLPNKSNSNPKKTLK
jgi:hypothetical protein